LFSIYTKSKSYFKLLCWTFIITGNNNLGPVIIYSWDYLNTVGSDDCFRITFSPLSDNSLGSSIIRIYIGLSTNFSIGLVFIPCGTLDSQIYLGWYIYNETQNTYASILSYDGNFSLASINPQSSWVNNDTISLRQELPQTFGTFQDGSTTSFVILSALSDPVQGVYNGSFLRITSIGSNKNIIANIKSYSGSPNFIATLNIILPTIPISSDTYEILNYSRDNFAPLVYSGTQIQQEVCYEVQCVNLILPNVAIKDGGIMQSYPYFLIDFQNFSTSNGGTVNIIYSNNPNTSRRLFKVPITDISSSSSNSFIKLDKCYMAQIVKLTPNNSFKFGVYLPNGKPLILAMTDNMSPLSPNKSLQISALFSLRRIAI